MLHHGVVATNSQYENYYFIYCKVSYIDVLNNIIDMCLLGNIVWSVHVMTKRIVGKN